MDQSRRTTNSRSVFSPVARNFLDASCSECTAPIVRPHKHADGNWYSPSESRSRWVHRQWWDRQRNDWACTCELGQVRRTCRHIERIQPLVKAGLQRAPGPVIVHAIGELFEDEPLCEECNGEGWIRADRYTTVICPTCQPLPFPEPQPEPEPARTERCARCAMLRLGVEAHCLGCGYPFGEMESAPVAATRPAGQRKKVTKLELLIS